MSQIRKGECSCAKPEDDYREKVTICAPSAEQGIIPESCLSKGSLLKIVELWNYNNPKDTLKYSEDESANDMYAKVFAFMKQKLNCTDEICWLDHVVPETSKHRGVRQSLLSLYRPKQPDRFKEKHNAWWSTSQINSVIEPYRYAFPFYWCGVVPLDFKDQRAVNICLSREACSVDMKQLVDHGCCVIGAIFNLDYSWETGSHWVAGMVDIKRGDVCFFDSYGYEPLTLIKEWL